MGCTWIRFVHVRKRVCVRVLGEGGRRRRRRKKREEGGGGTVLCCVVVEDMCRQFQGTERRRHYLSCFHSFRSSIVRFTILMAVGSFTGPSVTLIGMSTLIGIVTWDVTR